MAPGTGTTQLVASTLRRATASRHRACRAKPRSIDSIEEGFDRALPDRVLVLCELLDRAVVDDQDRPPELAAERLEPHPARGRLLGPAQQLRVRAVQVPSEQVTAVVQDQVRLGGEHLAGISGVDCAVL